MITGCVFSEKFSRGKVHGEDAYPYAVNDIVAVADGLGGRGPEQYKEVETGEIYTSAYIGANTVIESVKTIPREEINKESIKDAIIKGFNHAKEKYEKLHMGVSSSMFKIFPTTLAIGCIDDNLVHAFWCGDSRVYALDSKKGLIQITKDDLADEELNPFTNISEGGQMSQYVTLSSDFVINESTYHLGHDNTMVFAASDGAFDYFQSPMHFELFLLDTLRLSTSFDEFIFKVQSSLAEISGDDVSIGLVFVGSDSYASWKISTKERLNELKKDITPVEERTLMLSENSKVLEEIHREISESYRNIISMKVPGILEKLLEKQLTEEQIMKLRGGLSEGLLHKVDNYITEIQKNKVMLKELEAALLLEITKDYLNRESLCTRIWSNEYKYRALLKERCAVKENFGALADQLTEMGRVLESKSNFLASDLLREELISNEYIADMKNIFNEYMVVVHQGAALGKLAKRKERCDKAIIKLCQSVSEKNKIIYKQFLYSNGVLPFAISDRTQKLVEVFRLKILERKELKGNTLCLEREVSDCLSSRCSYEILSSLCDSSELSKYTELMEKEDAYTQQNATYEKEIQSLLEDMWDKYRESYEYYEKSA